MMAAAPPCRRHWLGSVALAFVLLIAVTSSMSVRDAVSRADEELAAEKGAPRTHQVRPASRKGKKWTVESKAMDARNRLMKRSADILDMDKFHPEAMMVAKIESTMGEMFNQGGIPGGMAKSCPHLYLANFACSPEAEHMECDPHAQYRTITGVCNNLNQPTLGAASTKLARLLPPAYADGIGQPRGTRLSGFPNDLSGGLIHGISSCDSNPAMLLPNPRFVSTNFHPAKDLPTPKLTHMFTQLAQYVDHDISISPEIENEECCEHFFDEECLPIFVPENDNFFGTDVPFQSPLPGGNFFPRSASSSSRGGIMPAPMTVLRELYANRTLMRSASGSNEGSGEGGPQTNGEVTCLELTRSTPFCEKMHPHSVREQMNAITSFIDASNVYGSSTELASLLRADCDGLLKVSLSSTDKELLPELVFDGERQFLAGDGRATEMPGLAAMHTLFVREHNRIARAFKEHRPEWDDDTLYEMSRRIVSGEWQNIVFGEFLSSLLGDSVVSSLELSPAGTAHYDPQVDPSVLNAFSTAAFRFGHTMIEGLIELFSLHSPPSRVGEIITVRDTFFDLAPYLADNGLGMERLVSGLVNQEAQSFDRFIIEDVTNFLFQTTHNGIGQDLVARNIQRGRDHGIPSYNAFRAQCGLSQPCSWNARPAEISASNWAQLKATYLSPGDVDLFAGGLAEESYRGGVLGRTFNCIVAEQFRRLKFGDRFFFTADANPLPFRENEKAILRQRNLAEIICDNTEIEAVPKRALLGGSPLMPCTSAFKLDIKAFLH